MSDERADASADPVLDRIDATIEGLCACGCETRLRSDGPSAYWASAACMSRWSNDRAESPQEVYGRPDAHQLPIPPADSPEPPEVRPASEYSRGEWARIQASRSRVWMAPPGTSPPEPSGLDELRASVMETLNDMLDREIARETAAANQSRPSFFGFPDVNTPRMTAEAMERIELVEYDGTRWLVEPESGARMEFKVNFRDPEITRWDAARRVDRPAVYEMTARWSGSWRLTQVPAGSSSVRSREAA